MKNERSHSRFFLEKDRLIFFGGGGGISFEKPCFESPRRERGQIETFLRHRVIHPLKLPPSIPSRHPTSCKYDIMYIAYGDYNVVLRHHEQFK